MMDIPAQVTRPVRRAVKALPFPWTIETKKDHYFLLALGERICVADNASRNVKNRNRQTVQQLQKLAEKYKEGTK